MKKYIIKRLLIMIPTILVIAIVIFTLMYFTPTDPAKMVLGDSATTEQLESYREYLGINKPYIEQLGDYLYRLFIKFDLGKSWILQTNVSVEIANRLPRTFAISMYSLLIGAACGHSPGCGGRH